MKLSIQMMMGSNESAVLEVPLKDVEDWDRKVAPALKRLEARVGDRARRIMAANKQLKDLQATDPVMANFVTNLVLVALGQMPEVGSLGLADGIENSVPVLTPAVQAANEVQA